MSSADRVHYTFSLDTPLPVRAVEGVVRLKGWCFTPHGATTPTIQLRCGDIALSTTTGLARADVAGAFPDIAHAATSGFELAGHIPAGLATASLWAGREGFGWEELVAFSIYAEAAVLHGAIDLPADLEITANCSIDGWCFHPQREIAELWLHYGTRQVRCRHYGHPRSDVAAQFPHLPQAQRCGFSSEDVLVPGEGRVRLRAVDRDGGFYFCETNRTVRIRPADRLDGHSDARLDGRALYRACSSRQATLPPLRLVMPATPIPAIERALTALATLPGDQWSLVALTENANASRELVRLAATSPRLTIQPTLAADSAAWTVRLQPNEIPDVHGLMAGWLACADHPTWDGFYGDFAVGEAHTPHVQPAWSPALLRAGGIEATAPIFLAPGLVPSPAPLRDLARPGTRVAHLNACLSHRLETPTPTVRPIFAAPSDFSRPRITVLTACTDAALPALQAAFGNSVEAWSCLPTTATPADFAAAAQAATTSHLLFLTEDCRPATENFTFTLAAALAESPRAAVVPLLLRRNHAPWEPADYFTERSRTTLGAFDPCYLAWADPQLALFDRETAYVALPGLLVARDRFVQLRAFASGFDSLAGHLLDLSFRLRAAGTPPRVCASALLFATPEPAPLTSFEETLLLDRWDQDDANPLVIRPLVPVEVLA